MPNRPLSYWIVPLCIATVAVLSIPGKSSATPPTVCSPVPIWTASTGGPVAGAPTFNPAPGMPLTFVASANVVTALDSGTGGVVWTRALAASVVGSAVPSLLRGGQSGVFVTVSNGDVVRLNPATGAVQWTQNLRRPGCVNDGLAATAAVQRWDLSDGTFQAGVPTDLVLVATRYVCTPLNQNRFYALRADTGAPFWTFNNPATFPVDSATEGGTVDYALNRVYFGTGAGSGSQPTTWAINTLNGNQAWAVPAGPMLARPTLRGSRLYMANALGQVIAMNTLAGGMPFWNAPVTTTQFVGTPLAETRPPYDQYLVLQGANGMLFALRDQGPAPLPAWNSNLGVGATSSPVGGGVPGVLYAGLGDGRVAEVDLSSGAIRGSRSLGGGAVTAAPAVDPDGGGPGHDELAATAGGNVTRYCLPFQNPILSRQQAITAVECLVIDPSPLDSVLVGFLLHNTGPDSVLSPGQVVTDWDSTFTRVLDRETYLFWLDLEPASFWEHPTQFVLMDARTGEFETLDSDSWPVVDGVQQNHLTFDGDSSPDRIHGHYTGVPTSYNYTPLSRPAQDGWGLVITGMNLVESGLTDGPAIAGDANRAVEILNGVEKGPQLPPGNITVVNNGTGGATGATNDEICAAIEALPKNCAKLYVYYTGHGYKEDGGGMVTRGADGKPAHLSWAMLRDKLLETKAKEVCLVLMACHSGTAIDDLNKALNPPGGKGPKIQLKGGVSTSSSGGQPTDRDPDGSPFMKAMLACWKDCAADLDNNHKITQFEAQAWAIANNPTVAGRNPQGQGLGGCAVHFTAPRTQTVNSGADGGGSMDYEVTFVYYKGEGKKVYCRGTFYVNNTAGSPHQAQKSVQIVCFDERGRPIGAPMVLTPQQLTLAAKQRRCITPLDPACRSFEVQKYPPGKPSDLTPRATSVPNSRAAFERRTAYYRRGALLLEEFQALGDVGQTLTFTPTPVAGWNVQMEPAGPLTFPAWRSDTVEVVFFATVPDTATQGARLRALVHNETTADTLCLEVQVVVYDSLATTIGAGQTHVLRHTEAYGGLSVAGGQARVLDGILEMRVNTPCAVLPGGSLELRDTAVEPGPGVSYTLDVSGALQWTGATLVGPANGLRLLSPPATIFRGGILNSAGDGLYAAGSMDSLDFNFFEIDSTAANGVVLDGVSQCLLRNLAVAHSGQNDVVLKNGSVAELRDSMFDPGKLSVEAGSTLTRSWSTNVLVLTSDGDPIPGITVRIVDALGDTVAAGPTGSLGLLSHPLVSAVHHGAVVTPHNPHQILVAGAGMDTVITYSAAADSTVEIMLPIPTSGVEPRIPEVLLTQNTPNPFLNRTTIAFRLLQPGYVKMQLLRPDGRLVRTLLDGQQSAGEHLVEISAADLPPGVYFYRLQCGATVKSRKLVVVG